jgi:hypothetical protein
MLDLSNNPIIYHDFYREFIFIFLDRLKSLDRVPIDRKKVEEIKQDSAFIKDILRQFLLNYLKIISTRSILTRLNINAEIRGYYGGNEVSEITSKKKFDLLQQNIVAGFAEENLIEFEAIIIDDLEYLMDRYYSDKQYSSRLLRFVDAWGMACSEFGAQQLNSLQAELSRMEGGDFDEINGFDNDEEELSKSIHDLPIPESLTERNGRSVPRASAVKVTRIGSSAKTSKIGKKEMDMINEGSAHWRNCVASCYHSESNTKKK